jgi:hypothetical protein
MNGDKRVSIRIMYTVRSNVVIVRRNQAAQACAQLKPIYVQSLAFRTNIYEFRSS